MCIFKFNYVLPEVEVVAEAGWPAWESQPLLPTQDKVHSVAHGNLG